jgi:hypothetical protein
LSENGNSSSEANADRVVGRKAGETPADEIEDLLKHLMAGERCFALPVVGDKDWMLTMFLHCAISPDRPCLCPGRRSWRGTVLQAIDRPGYFPRFRGALLTHQRSRLQIVAVLTVAASLATALPAAARSVHCSGNRYHAIDRAAFPGIRNEQAFNLPHLTSDYAPRCLVADSIAGGIQLFFAAHQRFPKRLAIHGGRWNAGTWRLSYTKHQFAPGAEYQHATARHARERVTMDLTS